MRTTPMDLVKSFFAWDKHAFWFEHFTDEEKQLRRMSVGELAKVINEARVRNLAGEAEKLIVAEHMLNVRLAKIQATASWGSGVLGFVGAIIGSAVSVALTMVLQSPKEVSSAPARASEKQAVAAPLPVPRESTSPLIKSPQRAPAAEVSSRQGVVSASPNSDDKKQPVAGGKP